MGHAGPAWPGPGPRTGACRRRVRAGPWPWDAASDRLCGRPGLASPSAGSRLARLNQPQLDPQLLVDFLRQVGVVLEEGAGVLAALAQAQVAVGVPGARFVDDAVGDAEVEQIALREMPSP